MSDDSKHQAIQKYIAQLNPAAADGLDFDADLLESEIVDSVAMMELVVWLEDNFGITIDTDDLVPENFSTVNRMVAFLERQ